jgi:hypothetical protein
MTKCPPRVHVGAPCATLLTPELATEVPDELTGVELGPKHARRQLRDVAARPTTHRDGMARTKVADPGGVEWHDVPRLRHD